MEYEKVETEADLEISFLKEKKKELKAELKNGRMDNVTYQQTLSPINKRIKDLEYKVSHYRYEHVEEVFHDCNITFSMIERHVLNARKSNEGD